MFESNRAITVIPVTTAVPQGRFLSLNASGNVALTGSTLDALGVSDSASAASSQVAIGMILLDGGKIEVEAGATVAAGDRVMSDATGRAITAVGATARVLGVALEAATIGQALTIIGQKAAGEFVA